MIKLYDLFNEIELRKGQLEPEDVDDNYLYESFFSEFLGVDLNEKNLDLSKNIDPSVFNKIKKDFRNEKIFILFILNFLLLRSNYDLENISFM